MKKVAFSAIDIEHKQTLFEDLTFEEPWWISLSNVSGDLMLLTVYNDTNNPDKKSVVAYDMHLKKIRWWRNNFAISAVDERFVSGTETGLGMKFLTLNLEDGLPCNDQTLSVTGQNFLVQRPLQYYPETTHFETVKSFLEAKHDKSATSLIEYMELPSLIFISCYVMEPDLANYLFVLKGDGALLLKERIGEQLKGIGVDTFFLLSGYLIFVKNKRELISYRMV